MKKIIASVIVLLVALCATATQYSCLSIVTETKKIGKWQTLKTWIETAGLKDEWDKCQYVSDEYPQYATVTNALVAGGVFTGEELVALLAATKDTAIPDNALRRVYTADVRTSGGRSKWHGKMVLQVIDTNLWIRTTTYEDGTKFTDKAHPPAPKRDYSREVVAKTNGIPVRLVEARKRWAANRNAGGVTNVTVRVRAGQ